MLRRAYDSASVALQSVLVQILLALRRLTYGTAINEEEKVNIATSKADTKERANKIALLNDALRQTFTGGKVMMTAAVDALPIDVKAGVLQNVRSFKEFGTANDPHGEHDFGSFKIDGETFFFKIDYYASDMRGGSEDPADPKKTTRVLTIMLASDY